MPQKFIGPDSPRICHVLPTRHDPDCQACPRGEISTSGSCAEPLGKFTESGGRRVLVVGGKGRRGAKPMSSRFAGTREVIADALKDVGAQVVWDSATRCPGGASDDGAVEACTPYSSYVLERTNPDVVLLVGSEAHRSWLGWSLDATQVRGGWALLDDGTPCWLLPDPPWEKNRILDRWLAEDVKRAAVFRPLAPSIRYTYIENPSQWGDVRVECFDQAVCFDVETYGQIGTPLFRLSSVAVSISNGNGGIYTWAVSWPTLEDLEQLDQIFKAASEVAGWNAKFDQRAMRAAGVEIEHVRDLYLEWKSGDTYRAGALEDNAALVGMGGHKGEMKQLLAVAKSSLQKLREARNKTIPIEWAPGKVLKSGKIGKGKAIAWRQPTPEEVEHQIQKAWDQVRRPKNGDPYTIRGRHGELTQLWRDAIASDLAPEVFIYGLCPDEPTSRYNAMDTATTSLLWQVVRTDKRTCEVLTTVPHIEYFPDEVGRTEDAGMLVDLEQLAIVEQDFDARLAIELEAIHRVAPGLNPNSDDQVADLLFWELGLTSFKKTKTGKDSVAGPVLKRLVNDHPVVAHLMEYSRLDKLQGAYARGLRRFVQADGRVHTSFNVTVDTGRMSCSDPALHQIPSRTGDGKAIKKCFIAPEGYAIVSNDYKALEAYLAAMMSGEPCLVEPFHGRHGDKPLDPHRSNAELVAPIVWGYDLATCGLGYSLDTPGITDEQRAALIAAQEEARALAKIFLFGKLFGQTESGFAAKQAITLEQASTAQEKILGRMSVLKEWIAGIERIAEKTGHTRVWWAGKWGRYRSLPLIGSVKRGERNRGARQAVNTPIQGGGSEYTSASHVRLGQAIREKGLDARIIHTVHDALIGEVLIEDVPEYLETSRHCMTDWPTKHGVPLRVDPGVGGSWGNLLPAKEWLEKHAA